MKIINLWQSLEEDVLKYNEAKRNIARAIEYYKKNIMVLINKFQTIPFDESDEIFNQLFKIQDQLSTLKYKYELDMDDYISNFIYYFDRQDTENKFYLYKRFHASNKWPM